jgi:hypothetical protein
VWQAFLKSVYFKSKQSSATDAVCMMVAMCVLSVNHN